ncbi:hypothetical protein EON64_14670 [archaeon]|nr:MAG: hypothetical protein EON64_14670 [archaeon]
MIRLRKPKVRALTNPILGVAPGSESPRIVVEPAMRASASGAMASISEKDSMLVVWRLGGVVLAQCYNNTLSHQWASQTAIR